MSLFIKNADLYLFFYVYLGFYPFNADIYIYNTDSCILKTSAFGRDLCISIRYLYFK